MRHRWRRTGAEPGSEPAPGPGVDAERPLTLADLHPGECARITAVGGPVALQERLRDLGFPPAAIKLLLQAKEGAPFVVAPGVTLVVDPNLIGSGAESGPLVERIRDLLADLLKEQASNDVDRAANQD